MSVRRLSDAELDQLLMQPAHALDMVNHLPDGNDWATDVDAPDLGLTGNQARLLSHAVKEAWAMNARLLAAFFLGDPHGTDARTYLPDWKPFERPTLGPWMTTASAQTANIGDDRVGIAVSHSTATSGMASSRSATQAAKGR